MRAQPTERSTEVATGVAIIKLGKLGTIRKCIREKEKEVNGVISHEGYGDRSGGGNVIAAWRACSSSWLYPTEYNLSCPYVRRSLIFFFSCRFNLL